jgi:hypothetical protein
MKAKKGKPAKKASKKKVALQTKTEEQRKAPLSGGISVEIDGIATGGVH